MNELVATLYTPHLVTARSRFETGAAGSMLDENFDPVLLELFLLNYCSRGVRMTEPVESWIERAGKRCRELGLEKLGIALQKHAASEANHHLMMIADTQALVQRWNASQPKPLAVEALLAVPASPAVDAYVTLHEDVIRGSEPYCQLAIEFEIERISVTWGPPFMRQCARLLGQGSNETLSFLTEHVEVDQGHTKFNELQLERLLTEHRSFAPALARTGAAALDIYGNFLAECLGFARTMRGALLGSKGREEPSAQIAQV
jgi:hypothetical protein